MAGIRNIECKIYLVRALDSEFSLYTLGDGANPTEGTCSPLTVYLLSESERYLVLSQRVGFQGYSYNHCRNKLIRNHF